MYETGINNFKHGPPADGKVVETEMKKTAVKIGEGN